jgi:hypothetical protein
VGQHKQQCPKDFMWTVLRLISYILFPCAPKYTHFAGTVDALMDAMKLNCTSLSGVYERSDAMLAVYPGEGARFAKHIDNSTGTCCM